MKIKAYVVLVVLYGFVTNGYGQNSTELHRMFGEVNVGFIIPDGEARLVRGDRKIVTTDMLNTYGFTLKFGYKMTKTRYATFSIHNATITYELNEDYTGGLKIYSDDDFSMTALNLGIQQYFGQRNIRPYGVLHLGYVIFQRDIDVFGEEYLNPKPEDQIVLFPYKYKTHDYFGFGVELGVDVDLTKNIGFVFNSSLYITDMRASLENDPEDDGIDIESPANPLSFSLGVKYYF